MEISRKKAMLLMCLCAFLWSIGGLFIKLLPWHPAVISGVRSAIGAVVILVYMKAARLSLSFSPGVWGAAVCLAGTMLLFVWANKLTTSANAIVLQSTNPVHIVLLSALFLGCRYSRREILAVAVTMGGIALFFLDQLTPGGLLGNLIVLGSGLTMGGMFLFSSRLPDDKSAMTALVAGHGLAAVCGMAFLPWAPPEITPATLGAILVLGVLQLGVPYILYAIAVRRCSPLSCSLISMIEPLLNPVWVFLAVGEKPGFFALVGGIIVLGTVTVWSVANAREASRVSSGPDGSGGA